MKLSELAYSQFKQLVFARDLRPGQFVSQRELVKLTGVTLGPMREALQRLQVEGLVQVIPQRGIKVADANPKLIRDAFNLRIVIEREAARTFAATASDGEFRGLDEAHQAIVDRARAGIDDALLDDAQRVDRGMHDSIVERLDNALIWSIHQINSDRIRLIRLDHGLLTQDNLLKAMEEHLAVIAAWRRRDAAAAATALETHLATAMRRAMGL